jgi:hypothetical protein
MLFMGLLDEKCREIAGDNYHRLDLSDVYFKVSPPHPHDHNMHLTFVNVSPIRWECLGKRWPPIYNFAVYEHVDSDIPMLVRPTGSKRVIWGDTLVIAPGGLVLSIRIIDPWQPWKPPKSPKVPPKKTRVRRKLVDAN